MAEETGVLDGNSYPFQADPDCSTFCLQNRLLVPFLEGSWSNSDRLGINLEIDLAEPAEPTYTCNGIIIRFGAEDRGGQPSTWAGARRIHERFF